MSDRGRRLTAAVLAVAVLGFMAVVVLSSGDGAGGGTIPNDVDGSFITGMAAHHKSALEMASIAVEKAEHPETRELAQSVITEQGAEIDELNSAHRRIYGEPIPANGMPHGGLDDSVEMTTATDLDALRRARPFDRAFIDMMVRHHQGAIRMAQAELDRGGDPEMRRLAKKMIATQTREIDRMRAWRSSWYAGS